MNHQFQQLADPLPSLVWTCRPNGEADFFNRKWHERTGQSLDEAIGWGWSDVIHPDDRERVVGDWGKIVRNPQSYEFQARYRMADGSYCWHLVRAEPMFDENNTVTHWYGISTDIDATHASLEGSEALNQAVVESAVDAIITIDQRGSILSFNPAAERLFGYRAAEAIGRNVKELMPAPYHSQHDRYVDNYVTTGKKKIIGIGREVIGKRKDGSTFPMELAVSELQLSGQRIFSGIVRDISDRKRLESELRGQSEVLECLARGDSLESVLTTLVTFAERTRPGMLGSVMLLDRESGTLQHGASLTLDESYCKTINGVAIGPRAGSCGTAAFIGQRVIVDDIQTSELWSDYRELAIGVGFRACWSEPIVSSKGDVLGTFAMYYRDPCVPNDADLTFATDCANLAALAIERVQADLAQRRMVAIVESTDAAVISTSLDNTIETWNRGAEQIYGYSAEEAVGKPISMLIPHDRWNEFEEIQGRLQRGEQVDQFETVRIAKNGRRIDSSLMISPIRSPEGMTIGYSVLARDVTQRKQTEAALQESQRQLSTLVSNLPGAAYRCRHENGWPTEFISDGCQDLCGYASADVMAGSPKWFDMIIPEDTQSVWDQVQAALVKKQPYQAVYRIRHRDGQHRWMWDHGRGVWDANGKLLALEGLITDMTELQNTREQLVQSERLATIGQMLTAIAHESRNALQRIQVGVEMLEFEIAEGSEASRDLQKIANAKDALHCLLEELRNYAAPIHLERSLRTLSGIWRSAWSQLDSAHADRDAKLIEPINRVDPLCDVDGFRMEQVFRNLFENVLAASSDPVRIHIECSIVTHDRALGVCVSVRDNGPGLTAEQQTKIFDAFFTTKSKGTGLGMAIAKRIIVAHSGTITAGNSDAVGGAEFKITLPLEGPY
ncbi:Sensor protein FixL [Rosistilla carotiformis]|uniref:Sensor protein FixL n=1 Tax=Rosistilla carotiformis TaxID=2528017 RepID=A0A518JTC9_9BACT|nr:PAS domain S-box protein [Rosistilla carotiformis]QDV68794.1 Sensor protein FixL [Rosistilla carotiformis]